MSGHLRGILTLFVLTVLLCCVVYPLALWAVGKAVFPDQAAGSLITKDGEVKGSKLIGQPFSGAGYFQPRPSAAGNGYNAALSGGSNLAASNPKLRERVAADVKKLIRYRSGPKKGKRVGPDVQEWMPKDPARVATWINSDPINADYVLSWWRQQDPAVKDEPKPEDLAGPFAAGYLKANPGTWPQATDKKDAEGNTVKDKDDKPVKELQPAADATDVRPTRRTATWTSTLYPPTPCLPPAPVSTRTSRCATPVTRRRRSSTSGPRRFPSARSRRWRNWSMI